MSLLAQIIMKLFALDDQNKALAKEARSRRTQADRWRKKYQKMAKVVWGDMALTQRDRKLLRDAELTEVRSEGEKT